MNTRGTWSSILLRRVRFWMTSRRFGLFLCVVGFIWGVTLINMTLLGYHGAEKDSKQLKEEILALSEKYVRQLARETENTIDGPYAGRLTGYDLKKTLAVLLESMLDRLDRLEARVDEALYNSTHSRNIDRTKRESSVVKQDPGMPPLSLITRLPGANLDQEPDGPKLQQLPQKEEPKLQEPVDARVSDRYTWKSLILGQQEQCELTEEQKKNFPHCMGKIVWMRAHWKSDPCYAATGVDGTDCSFRYYLSEVESWCPLLPGHKERLKNSTDISDYASINLDLEALLRKLQDPGQRQNYAWIRMRIRRLWPRWEAAAKQFVQKPGSDTSKKTEDCRPSWIADSGVWLENSREGL